MLHGLCEGNYWLLLDSTHGRSVTRRFDVLFVASLLLNNCRQNSLVCQWVSIPITPVWRHCNDACGQDICTRFALCCVLLRFGAGGFYPIYSKLTGTTIFDSSTGVRETTIRCVTQTHQEEGCNHNKTERNKTEYHMEYPAAHSHHPSVHHALFYKQRLATPAPAIGLDK